MTVLDQVLNPPTEEPTGAPPVEVGKLTVGQTLVTIAQIKAALERMVEAFQKIPEATPLGVDIALDELIGQSKAIIIKAERLKAANK